MRKSRRGKRDYTRLKILGALFLLVIIALVGVRLMPHEVVEKEIEGGEFHENNIKFIMLMGVDRRADDVGRSDTLMVVAIDEDDNRAALLSVPRDTRVAITGHGYDKINHAYAFGGRELTQKIIEQFLGVPIHHYVLIDTRAFERIINAVGGVDINVEKRMFYEDPWDDNGGLVIDLYPGEQHLDGYGAEQYVRYRDGEGDLGRIRRQQKFMGALLEQIINPGILPRLPEIVEKVSTSVETDMSPTELIDFARKVKELHDNGIPVKTVPGRPAYFEDISYWLPDIIATRQGFAEDIGVTLTDDTKTDMALVAAQYEKDLPKSLLVSDDKENDKDKKTSMLRKGDDNTDSEVTDNDKEREERDEPMKPSEIKVMVINSSGINGAGAAVAQVLQSKGFLISGVETGKTDSRENTTITTSTRNTDIFYGMPFPCVIMDGGSENQAVVNIGRDYADSSAR